MKKLFALVLATLMVLSMAACSAPAAQETAAPAAEEAAATEAPAAEAAEAPAEEGPVMKKIKESGKLVVGTEAQYAPYEFKDLDANFAGCDMWLSQQIADALGV